jgi:hypothetical protein
MMRVEQFAGPGDIELAELASAVFFDLVEGADPGELVRFLTDKVELPPAEATEIVGQENAKLQELMLQVAERLERNARPVDIAGDLVDRDWSRVLANSFVTRMQQDLGRLAQTAAGRDQLLAASRRRMLFGLLWFGGGVLVTWFTQYAAQEHGGGHALIAWGAVVYGLALLGMGAYQWFRRRGGGSL